MHKPPKPVTPTMFMLDTNFTVLQVQAGRIIARVNIEGQLFNAIIDTGFVSERVRTQFSLAEGSKK